VLLQEQYQGNRHRQLGGGAETTILRTDADAIIPSLDLLLRICVDQGRPSYGTDVMLRAVTDPLQRERTSCR
jgi:hypothetical protein